MGHCSVLCSTTPSHPFNSASMCTGCSQQSRTGRKRWPPRAAPSRCRCARGSLARRSTAARRRERCSATSSGGGSGGCTSSSGTSMPEGAQSGHVSMCAAPVDACCSSSTSQIRRELTAVALGATRCRPRPRPALCPKILLKYSLSLLWRPVRTVSALPTPHPLTMCTTAPQVPRDGRPQVWRRLPVLPGRPAPVSRPVLRPRPGAYGGGSDVFHKTAHRKLHRCTEAAC